MLKQKTALVLGAGASAPYGYPLGNALRLALLRLTDYSMAEMSLHAGLQDSGSDLHQFVDHFRRSQTKSIDAFLERRPEFLDIGKRGIAAVLLNSESEAALFDDEPDGHWYRELLKKFTAYPWDQLDFSNLSIVTFNYDRALEHYFFVALQNAYGKASDEVLDKLRGLEIIHVYGSLGPCLPNDSDYIPYGHGPTRERVTHAAKWLSVIGESREADSSLHRAKNVLFDADFIAFLGFGYDPTNLRRLNFKSTCNRSILREDGTHLRTVVGSCLGMKPAEVHWVADQIKGPVQDFRVGETMPAGFIEGDCLEVLRHTLILGY